MFQDRQRQNKIRVQNKPAQSVKARKLHETNLKDPRMGIRATTTKEVSECT